MPGTRECGFSANGECEKDVKDDLPCQWLMDKKEPTALADRKAQERTKQDSGNTEEEKVIVRVQDKFRRSQTEKGWNQYTF